MTIIKRLLPLTLCLLTVGAAHADLIKTGAAYNRTVLITSSTDHINTSVTVLIGDALPPVASGTVTVTYYLRGQAHSSATITQIATVTYDANKQQVSRTVKIAQPFPNF